MSSVFAYPATWYNNTAAGALREFDAAGTGQGTAGAAGANAQYPVGNATGTLLPQFTAGTVANAPISRDAYERTIALMFKVGGKPNTEDI